MSKDNIRTPTPEIPNQYDEDSLDLSYGLNALPLDEGDTDYPDEFPILKDKSHSSRRKITAQRHKRSVGISKVLQRKAISSEKGPSTGYKRVRILQPQCIELEFISIDDRSGDANFLKVFSTYDDYLDYLFDCYSENTSCTPAYLEATGVRLSTQSSKAVESAALKADMYAKRISCLYGQKKQAIQENKKKSASTAEAKDEVTKSSSEPVANHLICNNRSQTASKDYSSKYVTQRHNRFYTATTQKSGLKETKIPVVMKQPVFIPIIF